MDERRANSWPFIAAAMIAMLVVIGWFAWAGRQGPGDVARATANAIPDMRPKLPEMPHLPKPPIPVPK